MTRLCAGVAQLVEHSIRNAGARGSSPLAGTTSLQPDTVINGEFGLFGRIGEITGKCKRDGAVFQTPPVFLKPVNASFVG